MTESIYWDSIGFDSKGRETDRTHWVGHSFLTQYYQVLFVYERSAYGSTVSTPGIFDTSGVSQTLINNPGGGNIMSTQAGVGLNTYGIQVGTGAGANTGATSALTTLVANGVAGGQLSYGAMGITFPTGTAPLSYTFTRTLTNASGADIILSEIGLTYAMANVATAEVYVMCIRDVLSPTVTVSNGGFRTFTGTKQYTIA